MSTGTAGTTFEVSPVGVNQFPLPEAPYPAALQQQLEPEARRTAIESCCSYRGTLVADVTSHPFVAAVHLAFARHHPLVFSPDMIWLLVLQGLASHVNAHPERVRNQLVSHRGKASIGIRRDDFIKGSPENPWEEAFAAFSAEVRTHLGAETHDLLLPRFTTTGERERAAAEVVLLGAMRKYFDYGLATLCGIPRVTLEGEPEDWAQLVARTRALRRFELGWWLDTLVPVLEEFSAAARGDVHLEFWRSLYKETGESGGPYLTGWVTAFFPYTVERDSGVASYRNSWRAAPWWGLRGEPAPRGRPSADAGPTLEDLPSGLTRTPFHWEVTGRRYRMEMLAGFTGVRQAPETLALRPEIGWGVREGRS